MEAHFDGRPIKEKYMAATKMTQSQIMKELAAATGTTTKGATTDPSGPNPRHWRSDQDPGQESGQVPGRKSREGRDRTRQEEIVPAKSIPACKTKPPRSTPRGSLVLKSILGPLNVRANPGSPMPASFRRR